MKNKKNLAENIIHGIFLILGLVTVACVLLITVYLVISGIPAIRKIGIMKFLFGTKWASTAAEPEYGPSVTVNTAEGLRALPYAGIEYLECTHHIVHFHLTSGEDVPTLSLRVPFSAVAQPLLADGRFLQPHRSYVVNLAEADLLSAGELRMRSGARISIPRGREGAVRDAFQQWVQQQKYSLK